MQRWNADPVTNTMGFGNMGESMLTTFQVITVGTVWYCIGVPLGSTLVCST